MILGDDAGLHYFQRGSDGALTEQTAGNNPFGSLTTGNDVAPAFVDFDGDANSRYKLQRARLMAN